MTARENFMTRAPKRRALSPHASSIGPTRRRETHEGRARRRRRARGQCVEHSRALVLLFLVVRSGPLRTSPQRNARVHLLPDGRGRRAGYDGRTARSPRERSEPQELCEHPVQANGPGTRAAGSRRARRTSRAADGPAASWTHALQQGAYVPTTPDTLENCAQGRVRDAAGA